LYTHMNKIKIKKKKSMADITLPNPQVQWSLSR
jgi:hypothetical protein